MLNAEQIRDRIPHAGPMSLLQGVAAWDEARIHARAEFRPDWPHPLARDGVLPLTALAEYGAQAMAIHGQLLAGEEARPRAGLLVALGRLELHGRALVEATGLEIRANRLAGDAAGQVYRFAIDDGHRVLASGQATVMFSEPAPGKPEPAA